MVVANGGEEAALRHVSGHDRGLTRFTASTHLLARIEPEPAPEFLAPEAMARVTVLDEDRPDLRFKKLEFVRL